MPAKTPEMKNNNSKRSHQYNIKITCRICNLKQNHTPFFSNTNELKKHVKSHDDTIYREIALEMLN